MKSKMLKRIEIITVALALTSLLGCGKSPEAPDETKPAAPSPPPAPAAPAATPTTPAVAVSAPAAPDTAPAVSATGAIRYEAQSTGSKMKIDGTSSIHDWSMESVNVGGYMEVDAKFPESALSDPKAAKPVVSVFIPVRTLKSGKTTMDKVMQEHMKEPEHKKIEYKLIELQPKSPAVTTGALKFDAIGALTIAGVTKTNTMPVAIEKVEGNKLKVSGTTVFKMTEYGVKPPAPTIFGMPTISTGDEIKLVFEWLTAPKAP